MYVDVIVDLNLKRGKIKWIEFKVIDNVDIDINWIRNGNIVLGDCIEVGMY